MAERCKYAYRKRGDKSVHCRLIEGNMDYCSHQYLCPNTQRWEVNHASQCTIRSKGEIVKTSY